MIWLISLCHLKICMFPAGLGSEDDTFAWKLSMSTLLFYHQARRGRYEDRSSPPSCYALVLLCLDWGSLRRESFQTGATAILSWWAFTFWKTVSKSEMLWPISWAWGCRRFKRRPEVSVKAPDDFHTIDFSFAWNMSLDIIWCIACMIIIDYIHRVCWQFHDFLPCI